MKLYSDLILLYITWAIALVFMYGANHLSLPPDSIVIKIFDSLEPSQMFMYLVFGVLIFFILIMVVRRSQK
jgi:hypothetical protein